MSAPSITDVLRKNGFAPLSESSGLPKNARKNRNRKIKRAALNGAYGISALLGSSEYTAYTDPKRYGKIQSTKQFSTVLSKLPGIDDLPTSYYGGWGRLPNVSPIDYTEDDPRGWTHVDRRHRRARKCQIDDSDPPYDSGSA